MYTLIAFVVILLGFIIWQLTTVKKSMYEEYVDKYGKDKVDKGLDQLLKDIDDETNS